MYIILNYNRAAVFEKKRMIYKNYQLGHLFHSLAARMGQDKKFIVKFYLIVQEFHL